MMNYREYLRSRFGGRVLKIPVNAGFSCPNRDGAKGTDGCVFCDNQAFSPARRNLSAPDSQVRAAIAKYGGKYKLFLPYLQPFSNTYAPIDRLKSTYESIISVSGVIGLAIGTRPDCFDEPIYHYLGELNKRAYISVEIGLQSGHDKILARMNRRHTADDFKNAVYRLNDLKIETVAHIILGFPGETEKMVEETATALSKMPIHGVKVHQLMIIKSTPLERMFLSGEIAAISIDEYARLLKIFLSALRPNILIHRIAADSKPEYGLIAPSWSDSGNKMKVLDYLKRRILY